VMTAFHLDVSLSLQLMKFTTPAAACKSQLLNLPTFVHLHCNGSH